MKSISIHKYYKLLSIDWSCRFCSLKYKVNLARATKFLQEGKYKIYFCKHQRNTSCNLGIFWTIFFSYKVDKIIYLTIYIENCLRIMYIVKYIILYIGVYFLYFSSCNFLYSGYIYLKYFATLVGIKKGSVMCIIKVLAFPGFMHVHMVNYLTN